MNTLQNTRKIILIILKKMWATVIFKKVGEKNKKQNKTKQNKRTRQNARKSVIPLRTVNT